MKTSYSFWVALLVFTWLNWLSLVPLAAAPPLLTLEGVSPLDVTAFVDQVEIVDVATGTVVSGALANAGFEMPSQASVANGYSYAPREGSWSFSPKAGIARNGSGFGNSAAPEGTQVALVQYSGSLAQSLRLRPGTYRVRVRLAQRACCTRNISQLVRIRVDNQILDEVLPLENFAAFTTSGTFTIRSLTLTSQSPAANTLAAPNTAVGLTFSEQVNAKTAGDIRVFSMRYQGRRMVSASTSGSTVTLTPTAANGAAEFRPGETVSVSIPTTVRSTGGTDAVPSVYQFTTAVGGTGTGNFRAPVTTPEPSVGNRPLKVTVGDVNSDGDLDLVTANYGNNTVSVRLNDAMGSFSAPATYAEVAVGVAPYDVVLGDVDSDGDLDLVTANYDSPGTVSIRLNDGAGRYTAPPTTAEVAVGAFPTSVVLGDVDGDGDLDLLAATAISNTVSVRLNDGTGNFSAPLTNDEVAVGGRPLEITLGDVDGDLDLDLVTANSDSNTVSVHLNDGTGSFTASTTNAEVAVGTRPTSVALGDVDGDLDLDLLAANAGSGTVSVRLNDGTGHFIVPTTNADFATGKNSYDVVLGDVDADGDLDFVTANASSSSGSVRLNDGKGHFTAPATNAELIIGAYSYSVALGDLDGDGDLDLVSANDGSSTVSVRLNQPPAPVLTQLSASSTAPGNVLTLTGSYLNGSTLATFTHTSDGALTTVAAAAFTGTSYATTPQTISLLVPSTLLAGVYTVSVTTPDGLSNDLPLTVCVLTAAVKPVSLPVLSNGNAYVAGFLFDNGSTSSCGPITTQLQAVLTAQANEGETLTLTAPAGMVFTAVTFASYGTPTGSDGTYALGSCHAAASRPMVEAAALGQHTFSLPASNATFGDPCGNTAKRLVVQAVYGVPVEQLTYSCAVAGTNPVLVTLTDAAGTIRQVATTLTISVPTGITTTTWIGATGTDWNDCGNWSYGIVPNATVSAVVPANGPQYPLLPPGSTATAKNLTIETGGRLTVDQDARLVVEGNFVNNGQVECAGTLAFVGDAPTQLLGGIVATALGHMEVNKTSGYVQLQRDLSVDRFLTLTSGTLTTGSYMVTLSSAASLSETNRSYVTGTVKTSRTITSGTAEDFGGLGLTLTPETSSPVPGNTAVVRTTGTSFTTGMGTGQSIQRYFDIQPANNARLDVTLAFSYFEHERNGIAAADLSLFHSTTGPGGPWEPQGPVINTGNTVRKTGIPPLGYWTLGSVAAPLPVELVDFTAQAQGHRALLRWATASEQHSDRFEVEVSVNGTTFRRIGSQAGQGTSTTRHAYAFEDKQLLSYGVSLVYYRLRQLDQNGTATYSSVRAVQTGLEQAFDQPLVVYPSPLGTAEELRYALAEPLAQHAAGAELTVYTLTGQRVSTQRLTAGTAGRVTVPPLPAGSYLVRLRLSDGHPLTTRFSVR